MPYFIDGHNLIPHIPGIQLDEIDDEIRLLNLLDQFFRKERKTAVVFFDKASPVGQHEIQSGFVRAHFTRPPLNADKAIKNAIKKVGRSAANYTVISSDFEVMENALRMGARVISSSEFALQLTSATKKKKDNRSKPSEDVDYWLKIFEKKS